MLSRMPGAAARALLAMLLIILPITMIPVASIDGALVVMVVALFVAAFTIAEYSTASPSLIEFRDAPPFNRIRFATLFLAIFLMTVILGGDRDGSTLHMAIVVVGDRVGHMVDFPYSPVRLLTLAVPADTPQSVINNVRSAAGVSYLLSLFALAIFLVIIRDNGWPRRTQSFNFWVNLPTFDPTAGGDVVQRLNRDCNINMVLGFLLPFMIPAALKASATVIGPVRFDEPQTLIWTVAIWAFLPASLLMRGVALSRVAQMIHMQRKKAYAAAAAEGMLPV
ncbi:MAG: hypothetical protein AAFQ64_13935 [Pseudomonadota bacterium]